MNEIKKTMNYFKLPKIDLHCHLDGSVRPETIIDLAKQLGVEIPSTNIEVMKSLMVAPENCPNLMEYLSRFHYPVSVMQTEEALERITFELYEDAAKENVKYLETRYGPQLHRQNGLTFDQIIASTVRGMRKAEEMYDIKGNLIISVVKVLPKNDIYEMIDSGAKYIGNGIVAFDLAASEDQDFCHDYIEHTEYAIEKGYRITIHAGEQGYGQNVHDAIKLLHAERIGHGIAIRDHKASYNLVYSNRIALETCPTSNVQTKAVQSLADHSVNDFYQDGIVVTINTDNRTVSDTTMTKELQKTFEQFDLSLEDYKNIYRNSVENAFTTDEIKKHLLSLID
ncbi:adenosine deaminase [Photobacterium profundum 3TCK]|uniref:Adenosine deaminase n=2 Tax=Photobacterium profundum TaxID=74109 RepID=Q1Z9L1_9GAMM|nr:adenosine deaminase [Photobacterium profundum 3TCK]